MPTASSTCFARVRCLRLIGLLLMPGLAHAAPAGVHDLSAWGMFVAADWVVKGVMLVLVFASLTTWTIWLAKTLELGRAERRSLSALHRLGRAGSVSEADRLTADCEGPVRAFLAAADLERRQAAELPAAGIRERLAGCFARIEADEIRRARRAVGVLATVGSTAPFIGLFGTVWGIMNSFIGIADAQTTNLAVVAPGIAEALLATALGLVAAIPAVMMYNHFARRTGDHRARINTLAGEILRLVSLDLDRREHRAWSAAEEAA